MVYRYAIGGNEISPYRLDIDSPHFYLMCQPYGTQEKETKEAWSCLFDLGKACRQLYHETKLLPYKLNVFNISLGGHFSDFLLGLDDTKKKAITTVSFGFRSWVEEDPMTFQFTVPKELRDCTGLKTAICIITLHPIQTGLVFSFATKRGLKFMVERKGISNKTWSYLDAIHEADMLEWEQENGYDDDY